MDVKISTVKTYCIQVTEPQARDLLRLSRAIDADLMVSVDRKDRTGTLETLSTLRQALLASGLSLKDPS